MLSVVVIIVNNAKFIDLSRESRIRFLLLLVAILYNNVKTSCVQKISQHRGGQQNELRCIGIISICVSLTSMNDMEMLCRLSIYKRFFLSLMWINNGFVYLSLDNCTIV